MMANLKTMMASVGGKFMKIFRGLATAFTTFGTVMRVSFITPMLGALTTMATAAMGLLTPLLPIIAIFAVIAGALYLLKEKLGFTSIFDVIMLGVAHLQDAFGHVVNAIGSIVNFIFGIVEGIASFIGFDVELPKVPKMSTDNAEKKKAELDLKAEQERIKKAEEERKQAELNAQGPGTEMLDMSTQNALANVGPQKETKVITQQNVSQNRSESNRVTVLSGREHRSSGFMGAYAR